MEFVTDLPSVDPSVDFADESSAAAPKAGGEVVSFSSVSQVGS